MAEASGKNPYAVGELDPRKKLRKGSGVRFGLSVVPKVTASHPSGKIKIADVCNAALEPKDRYVILRAALNGMPQRLWNVIRSCDLVVADSPWDVDVGALTENRVVIALIIVATGVPVLPVKAWACAAPHLKSNMVVHFQAACCLERKKLVMTPAFQTSRPALAKTFENVCKFKHSKWKFAVSEEAGSGGVKLSTLESVRSFLQGARRVHRQHRGLSGRYFPAAKAAP